MLCNMGKTRLTLRNVSHLTLAVWKLSVFCLVASIFDHVSWFVRKLSRGITNGTQVIWAFACLFRTIDVW